MTALVRAFPTGAPCTWHVWCLQCGTGQSAPELETVARWVELHDAAFPPLTAAHEVVAVRTRPPRPARPRSAPPDAHRRHPSWIGGDS